MNPVSYILTDGHIVLPDRVIEGGVVVKDGLVVGLLHEGEDAPESLCEDLPRCGLGGRWVTPGLMELHIHGAGGVGFDNLDPDALGGAAEVSYVRDFLLARGISSFLPTLVAEKRALRVLAAALEAGGFPPPDVPGIYIEGPFINPRRKGGIPLELIADPDLGLLDGFIAEGAGRIRLMTLAPELAGAGALSARIAEAGIIPCLGHSDAILGQFPLPSSDFSITHLFNAMSPISHKDPGLAILPFVDHRPYVELIADGVHVNGAVLTLCARALDPERLLLISDAAAAAGLPDGEYEYLGRKTLSGPRGVRYADSDVLIGSRCLGPELLKNWVKTTGASLPAAVRALSLNPRRLLGIRKRGAIAPGMEADIVVWEGDFDRPADLDW
jgi:N-acetylglucosamine-6-phosphate deacetylase